MASKAIIFIDGNNLYHNAKAMHIKLSPDYIRKIAERACAHFNCILQKAIYYNSVPSIADGEEMYYKHIKFLDKMKALPKFEVKTRKLQRRSNAEVQEEKKAALFNLGLCKTCMPLVESNCADCVGAIDKKEKGVDMLIGIDMINLSIIQKECDCCILISGDADFIPAMDLIRKCGKKVFSAFLTKGYSYDIRQKFKFFIMNKEFLNKKILHPNKKK